MNKCENCKFLYDGERQTADHANNPNYGICGRIANLDNQVSYNYGEDPKDYTDIVYWHGYCDSVGIVTRKDFGCNCFEPETPCQFKFKDALCGYDGNALECDKTLECCERLENQKHFGGVQNE